MTGKLVTLSKPLVVLEKAAQVEAAGPAAVALDPTSSGTTFGTQYHVKAVVRRKLLFEDRPQPIVSARNAPRVA